MDDRKYALDDTNLAPGLTELTTTSCPLVAVLLAIGVTDAGRGRCPGYCSTSE